MSDILTADEVAALLDCEPSTIQAQARAHELPGIKIGRSWRFPRVALLEALNRKALENQIQQAAAPKAVTRKPAGRRAPPTLPNLT
ncbi:helix-turn-helix domain-containing protein [Comamonas sp. Z3]|uniref:helix-turn-helix domain-containing protein n=1 Tax=Comamonas TaxID=283 RepID=UPI0011E858E1|nr:MULTISPECIES: helix-turn-helix domain-containing protein [Comamonas]TYK73134.1 helix-turn-helix domain-containing protein [Comamonas sp. Z3]